MIYSTYEEERILEQSGLLDHIPEAALAAVKTNYSEPHRHYHAWHHALSTVSWVNHVITHQPGFLRSTSYTNRRGYTPSDLTLAALYHDAVYDAAGSPFNEERSVRFMKDSLVEEFEPDGLDNVESLIVLTAYHGKLETPDVSPVEALFLDCDIANFGEVRWEIVMWNEQNIQAELLSSRTPAQVQLGRKAFLIGFLSKKSIFLSQYFQDRFEAQARRNVARLIESLS